MARFLLFRRKLQGANDFVDTVRNLVRDFDGTPADRLAIVNQVIRRCGQPDMRSNGRMIVDLERILDGFLEPWYEEQRAEQPDSTASEESAPSSSRRTTGSTPR